MPPSLTGARRGKVLLELDPVSRPQEPWGPAPPSWQVTESDEHVTRWSNWDSWLETQRKETLTMWPQGCQRPVPHPMEKPEDKGGIQRLQVKWEGPNSTGILAGAPESHPPNLHITTYDLGNQKHPPFEDGMNYLLFPTYPLPSRLDQVSLSPLSFLDTHLTSIAFTILHLLGGAQCLLSEWRNWWMKSVPTHLDNLLLVPWNPIKQWDMF